MAIPLFESDVWPDSDQLLHVARISDRCTVLGPGVRAVVWLQGCVFRCAECVVPEMLPFAGGEPSNISDLAKRLLGLPHIEGVTFSGGEPMSQAAGLTALVDQLRAARDLSVVCYTGYTMEQLQRCGSRHQHSLLERLDLLIDGPYLPERHTELQWRGSDNQRLHFLTDRYRHLRDSVQQRGRWLEFELSPGGELAWMGIPPRGFRAQFAQALAQAGIRYSSPEEEP